MDTWIVFAVLALAAIYAVVVYNVFVSLSNRARGAWSDVDVQLKRRHDLVPNLVEAVKGYASHEKSTFEEVARLRSEATQARKVDQKEPAEDQLQSAIKSIFAIAESYPQLKADANFRDLQKQLAEVEDNIQYARRYYNAVVRDFNTKRESFPSGIIGGLFGMTRLPYFQASDDEREAVQVELGQEEP